MDFTIEFYETASGACPVRDFLDELKASDPNDFAAVVAGLAKLRNKQHHREPFSPFLFQLPLRSSARGHWSYLTRIMVLLDPNRIR